MAAAKGSEYCGEHLTQEKVPTYLELLVFICSIDPFQLLHLSIFYRDIDNFQKLEGGGGGAELVQNVETPHWYIYILYIFNHVISICQGIAVLTIPCKLILSEVVEDIYEIIKFYSPPPPPPPLKKCLNFFFFLNGVDMCQV